MEGTLPPLFFKRIQTLWTTRQKLRAICMHELTKEHSL
jgi:hypothetical protein